MSTIDLSRVITPTKNKPVIKSSEKHPDLPVLQFCAVAEKGKKTIKLNHCAFDLLKVSETNKDLVLFEKYNISSDPESASDEDLVPAIAIVNAEAVSLPKGQKTYEIALHTRNVKSKALHEFVMEYFGLNEKENNYIQLIPTIYGAFTLHVLNEVFDKGAEVLIESAPMNEVNQA
jgi:hypothetical protein